MKKIIAIIAAGIFLISGQAIGQGFTIHGKVTGVQEGQVTLQARGGGDKYSTGIVKGEFTLKGKVAVPGIHTLRIDGVRGTGQIFVDNSKMSITADADDMRNLKVTGSKAHDVYAKYLEINNSLSTKYKPLNDAYSEARKANDEAKMKELQLKFDGVREEQAALTDEFIKQNNKSVAAAYILASTARNYEDPAKLEAALNSLDKSLANNVYVVTTRNTLLVAKKTAIGQPAMEFTQNDPDGKPVSLSDFKGKVVLVDFWAAWCGPCRAENPNVVAAYKKFKDKGFTVLGVSLDKTKDKWMEAVEKDGLTWTHVSDLQYWDNAVAKMYGIQGIPANILVGKDGRIIAKNLRGDDLHEKLAEVL